LLRGYDGVTWTSLDAASDAKFAGRFEEQVFALDAKYCATQLVLTVFAMRDELDMRCSTPRCMQLSELRLLPADHAWR